MSIEVSFIDARTGQAFGRSFIPAENLPQSFARDTKLELAGEYWHVVRAEPPTAQEFTRAGKLTLTVEKMVRMAMPEEK